MVKRSFNTITTIFSIIFIIILFGGSYVIHFISQKNNQIPPQKKPLKSPQYGPHHPCDSNKTQQTSVSHLFHSLVYAHMGEGYDRWGIKINVPNTYICEYIIEFNVREPHTDWSYTQKIHGYAFPDQIVRFQPPAEIASAEIIIYAITPEGKTNNVSVDSLDFWDAVHQFPINPKLGEVTLEAKSKNNITLILNNDTKLFE